MNFIGKITEISTIKNGKTKKGDDWASLDFEVTESNPQNADYPQIGLFSFFKMGEYVKYAQDFNQYHKLGDEINVEFNLKCQKYTKKDGSGEGKFYKNECWKLEKVSEVIEGTPVVDQPKGDDNEPDDLPF